MRLRESGIYGLTDEQDGRVCYIGRAFDIHARYRQHLNEGRWEARRALGRGWLKAPVMSTKRNWLAYMNLEARPVGLVLLEPVEPDIGKQADREDAWTLAFSKLGIPLANGTTAGMQVGSYRPKGKCPYTPGLPTQPADSITSPDGLLRPRPRYLVIPVLELPALRRLRKDRPDLHAEVLAGRLSAHAAMVKAGYRPKTFTVRADSPESVAATLRRQLTAEQLAELARLLSEGN